MAFFPDSGSNPIRFGAHAHHEQLALWQCREWHNLEADVNQMVNDLVAL